jgi:hypothetical protein
VTSSFISTDVDPAYQDAVRNLYYSPHEDGFAKTFPADTPNLDRIFLHFEHYAQEMVLQTARVYLADWEKSLTTFLNIIF